MGSCVLTNLNKSLKWTKSEGIVLYIVKRLLQSFVWIVPGLIMGGEKKSKEKAR